MAKLGEIQAGYSAGLACPASRELTLGSSVRSPGGASAIYPQGSCAQRSARTRWEAEARGGRLGTMVAGEGRQQRGVALWESRAAEEEMTRRGSAEAPPR